MQRRTVGNSDNTNYRNVLSTTISYFPDSKTTMTTTKRKPRKRSAPGEASEATEDVMDDLPHQQANNKKEEPTYTPVSLKSYIKKKRKYHPNCFGCRYRVGKPIDPQEEWEMAELHECIVFHRTSITPKAFAEAVNECQVRLFVTPYKEAIEAGTKDYTLEDVPPEWTVELILEHYDCHGTFMETELEQDFEKLKYAAELLSDRISKINDDTGEETTHKDNVEQLLKVINLKQITQARIENAQHGGVAAVKKTKKY